MGNIDDLGSSAGIEMPFSDECDQYVQYYSKSQ